VAADAFHPAQATWTHWLDTGYRSLLCRLCKSQIRSSAAKHSHYQAAPRVAVTAQIGLFTVVDIYDIHFDVPLCTRRNTKIALHLQTKLKTKEYCLAPSKPYISKGCTA
jgi:hypothetical protein